MHPHLYAAQCKGQTGKYLLAEMKYEHMLQRMLEFRFGNFNNIHMCVQFLCGNAAAKKSTENMPFLQGYGRNYEASKSTLNISHAIVICLIFGWAATKHFWGPRKYISKMWKRFLFSSIIISYSKRYLYFIISRQADHFKNFLSAKFYFIT